MSKREVLLYAECVQYNSIQADYFSVRVFNTSTYFRNHIIYIFQQTMLLIFNPCKKKSIPHRTTYVLSYHNYITLTFTFKFHFFYRLKKLEHENKTKNNNIFNVRYPQYLYGNFKMVAREEITHYTINVKKK